MNLGPNDPFSDLEQELIAEFEDDEDQDDDQDDLEDDDDFNLDDDEI